MNECFNPFTGDFTVTVSNVNSIFFSIKVTVKQVFE